MTQSITSPIPASRDGNLAESERAQVFSPMTLLSVLEVSLDETIGKLDDASGRISERVMQHELTFDVELIMGLQGLDRLHQELAACSAILKHCVARLSDPESQDALDDPVAAITLADLKKRIYDRCCNDVAMTSQATSSQAIF